jgi:hypothetical protein
MISKIKYISARKMFGLPIHKTICGYEGWLRVVLKAPVPGGKIHVESKNASGRTSIPIVNTVIDLPKNGPKKQRAFFTDSFSIPISSMGATHIMFSVKVIDKNDNVIEEKNLTRKLIGEGEIERELRDNLIFGLVVLTFISTIIMFLYR